VIFGDRQANAAVGTLGLVAQRRFSTSRGYITPALRVSVDRDLSQSAKTYRFGFVGGQNFDETYREPDRTVGRVGVGLKARLSRGLGLDLTADSAISGSDGDDRRAAAQLSYRF
jgi:outer membrane autotransporter protein